MLQLVFNFVSFIIRLANTPFHPPLGVFSYGSCTSHTWVPTDMLDSQSSQFFQDQDLYTPFLEQSFEEKSELEKNIEILHETTQ